MNIARKALFMTGKENFRAVLTGFSFISDSSNWLAITVLASYILAGRMNISEGGAHIANGIPEGTIGNVRPDLHRNFNPWDRISEPSGLYTMLAEAGVHTDNIVTETGTHP